MSPVNTMNRAAVWCVSACLLSGPKLAVGDVENDAPARFGGPDAVPNQIESDALDALMGWGTAQG